MKTTIENKIDELFVDHNYQICLKEATNLFGKGYKDLTIDKCSEEKFKMWWEQNHQEPYKEIYYDVALFVWDEKENYIS